MNALSQDCKFVKVSDVAAANTTAVNGTSVDLGADGGWDGVCFLTSFGTAAADNLMKAQGSDDNSSFSDLAGSEVNAGASDEDQFVDIVRPKHRYVRPVLTRGTSTTVENIWAILYRGSVLPFSNVTAGTINGVTLASPAAGTA